jgi:DNA (cytosine-5)-methyltransferase 1
MAGADVIFANDVWDVAAETYRLGHPSVRFFRCPIEELSVTDILQATGIRRGELDILLGGPPCQGFSIYAPTRTRNDKRNHLILEYLRVVEGLLPKYIIMENVPGLLSLSGGYALKWAYDRLSRIGYSVQHRVLLAARYGVPQERWRLIIIGRRWDMPEAGFPAPTHRASARANFTHGAMWARDESLFETRLSARLRDAVTVAQAIGDLPPLKNGEGEQCTPMPRADPARLSAYQRWARRGAHELWNHVAPKLSQVNLERIRYVSPGGSWREIPFDLLPSGMKRARRSDHTKRYGRLDPGALSCTILTKCDPHWGAFFHYSQDRAITPREAARLQSFPDRYVFRGTLTAQYAQIGNAVPPLLARAVITSIIRAMVGKEETGERLRPCLEAISSVG